jgi:hypothetical protein
VEEKYAIRAVTVVDVLDRILDKGIVIDAWVRVSVVGFDLHTVEARVVVAAFETHTSYGQRNSRVPSNANPPLGPAEPT